MSIVQLEGREMRTADVYLPVRQDVLDPTKVFLAGSIRWHSRMGPLFTAGNNIALTADELAAIGDVLTTFKGAKDFLAVPLGQKTTWPRGNGSQP